MNIGRLLFLVVFVGILHLLYGALYDAGLGAAIAFLIAVLAFHAWWYRKHGELFH